MRPKATLILLIIFSLCFFIPGCGNNAQKKPATPSKKNLQTTVTLSDSEQRIIASKVSNMAKLVEGVDRASVVVVNPGIIPAEAAKKPVKTTVDPSTSKSVVKETSDTVTQEPIANYPDINSTNINALTDDNNRLMAAPGGGVAVIIGASVTEEVRADQDKWKEIKAAITKKVTASDDRISQVFITHDPEVVGKIDELAAAILQGKGSENYKEEIKDILKEINTP